MLAEYTVIKEFIEPIYDGPPTELVKGHKSKVNIVIRGDMDLVNLIVETIKGIDGTEVA